MTSCHQHRVWKPHWMKDWLFFCLFFWGFFFCIHGNRYIPPVTSPLSLLITLRAAAYRSNLVYLSAVSLKNENRKGNLPCSTTSFFTVLLPRTTCTPLLAKSSLRACRAHLKQVPSAMFSNNNGYRESVSVLLRNGPGQHLLFETVVFASSNTASVLAGGWNWLKRWGTLIMWDLKTVFLFC